jgi:ComF family protein
VQGTARPSAPSAGDPAGAAAEHAAAARRGRTAGQPAAPPAAGVAPAKTVAARLLPSAFAAILPAAGRLGAPGAAAPHGDTWDEAASGTDPARAAGSGGAAAPAGGARRGAGGRHYPPACAACGTPADADFGLCPACWRGAGFLGGLVCDACGTALPGTDPGEPVHCDDCLALDRPWSRGRAVMDYGETARRLVLALKHGDRLELARPMGDWMARAARPILVPGMVVAPVPLHWLRLLRRRSNQAALLSARIARATRLEHVPDLLIRARRTPSQDGRDRQGRFENVAGAIRPHPRRRAAMQGRHVLLVDDVMTSGATFAAAAEACLQGGAAAVSVVAFARVARGG